MNTNLRTILLDWQSQPLPAVLPRAISLSVDLETQVRLATVITGFRRVGKTYLMYQTIQKLLKSVPRDQILYLNFEDERLGILDSSLLTSLIPTFQAIHGHKPKYIFLDELQLVPNWSKWVRRVLDTELALKLYITGSTSKMSSAELPTELRGRSLDVKLNPLDFTEFLSFKNFTPANSFSMLSTNEQAQVTGLFEEYLIYGGLPAVVQSPLPQKTELLQTYFKTVVSRDLLERHHLKDGVVIKTILKYLANSPHFTISKLYNNLKSLGFAISKSTIITYLEYIKNSYFFSSLSIYHRSVHNALLYPRAGYLVDNGFHTVLSPVSTINYGRLYENLVYSKLASQYQDIHYYRNKSGHEVDYIVENDTPHLIQASYDTSNLETYEREQKSLTKCSKDFPKAKSTIITHLPPLQSLGPLPNLTSSLDFFLNNKGIS